MKRLLTTLMLAAMCAIHIAAQETIISGGKQRNIIVYAPSKLPDNRPLLISMHGANQDANYQRNQAKYEDVADTAKFVVVYPDGEGKSWDLGGTKDINFILDIIDLMATRHKIDRNRVYLSGFSMGGMMTYYAMTKIADKIAAFAPVSGYNMGGPNATSSRPIPIIHVHGTADDVCTYAPVQSHIDAWVNRNKCNTSPITIAKGTSKEGTLFRYTGGLEGVEVAHLKLPGKGHWHSNDPVYGMSNIEIWNFCSRFSLVAGPAVQSVSPENNSFDMNTETHRTFSLTFDKAVNCDKVKGTLARGSQNIALTLAETGESTTLTFTIPADAVLEEASYKLKVSSVEGTDGSVGGAFEATYTYGIEEVGDVMNVDTILTQDWYSQRDVIGEGIPDGWKRVNTNSDGTDEKGQNTPNVTGCRMKYFLPSGEIAAGFYLSAREYDRVDFTYGTYTGKTLVLKKGKYWLSFNSTYWTKGAQDAGNTFSVSFINSSDKSVVFSEPSLKPEGCLEEKSEIKITKCAHHVVECDLTTSARYWIQFSYASGWNGIILGQPMLTTAPSTADLYKGGFLRTMKKAKAMLESIKEEGGEKYAEQMAQLEAAINQYDGFSTIQPSEYEAATNAITDAMKKVEAVGINAVVPTSADNKLYDLSGRSVSGTPQRGIYILNGKKIAY